MLIPCSRSSDFLEPLHCCRVYSDPPVQPGKVGERLESPSPAAILTSSTKSPKSFGKGPRLPVSSFDEPWHSSLSRCSLGQKPGNMGPRRYRQVSGYTDVKLWHPQFPTPKWAVIPPGKPNPLLGVPPLTSWCRWRSWYTPSQGTVAVAVGLYHRHQLVSGPINSLNCLTLKAILSKLTSAQTDLVSLLMIFPVTK